MSKFFSSTRKTPSNPPPALTPEMLKVTEYVDQVGFVTVEMELMSVAEQYEKIYLFLDDTIALKLFGTLNLMMENFKVPIMPAQLAWNGRKLTGPEANHLVLRVSCKQACMSLLKAKSEAAPDRTVFTWVLKPKKYALQDATTGKWIVGVSVEVHDLQ